jgi:cytosine/adenosine deaminase-related metal-dependent hydrolase
VGEGTDKASCLEIDELLRWNLFKRKLIGIHGVAMNRVQAPLFRALVWCPASNYFLLNKTAPVHELKQLITILFGTHSTLTAPWNIWDHLRLARTGQQVTDQELFSMLTSLPAAVWKLAKHGRIAAGQQADIIIGAEKAGMKGFDAFYGLNPEDLLLVLQHGNIRMFDETLLPQLARYNIDLLRFSKIRIHDRCKYVYGDLPALIRAILKYYPGADFPVRIAAA